MLPAIFNGKSQTCPTAEFQIESLLLCFPQVLYYSSIHWSPYALMSEEKEQVNNNPGELGIKPTIKAQLLAVGWNDGLCHNAHNSTMLKISKCLLQIANERQ